MQSLSEFGHKVVHLVLFGRGSAGARKQVATVVEILGLYIQRGNLTMNGGLLLALRSHLRRRTRLRGGFPLSFAHQIQNWMMEWGSPLKYDPLVARLYCFSVLSADFGLWLDLRTLRISNLFSTGET